MIEPLPSGKPMPESIVRTAIRYTQFSLVGGTNALVDIGVLNLILLLDPTRAPGKLVLYNAVALVLANANSYLWNTLWTFRHHARHDARQLSMFAAQAALNVAAGRAFCSGSWPAGSSLIRTSRRSREETRPKSFRWWPPLP